MNIDIETREGWTVFHLDGDLDSGSAADLQSRYMKSLNSGLTSFLVDLGKVHYVDSSGLAALVKLYKETRTRGGSLGLCAVQKDAMKIFQLTRLDKIFTIYPDTDSARAA